MGATIEEIRQELKAKKAVGMNMIELRKWIDESNLDIGIELKGAANSVIGKILDAMKEGKVQFRSGSLKKESKISPTPTETQKVRCYQIS
jgi:hypothetical protein